MTKLNIKEVAKKAQVSLSTVSRTLNNSGYVSKETRQKVEKVVSELNYSRNMLARKFRTKKTHFIGLIIPDIANDFFAHLSKNIEFILQKNEYGLFLCNSEENPEKENFYINSLLDNQVEAIIITPSTKVLNKRLMETITPVICADRLMSIKHSKFAEITSDNENGGRIAAEKLISKGAQNIVILNDGREAFSPAIGRINGFSEYANKNKKTKYSIFNTTVNPKAAYKTINSLIGKVPFDAVFCTSDIIAIGALKCLEDYNIAIPDRVQLIGFDGITFGRFLPKPISTIVQDVETMGKVIGETVLKMINKKPYDRRMIIPVSFFEGKTTREEK
ncbi:MAG: LacI family transcriptional regulator [Treponema sp.]|nr:LacI family transcriptional regulator [Treponema sp.]